jgi:flavin-dependent dehydrogenase
MKAVLQGWEEQMKRHGLGRGTAKVRGHLIPCGGFPRCLGRGRALLAGDAAGFVDAFTGEGIALAIRSGRLAAEALAATATDNASCVKVYTSRSGEAFGADLRWALRIKRLAMRAPRFLETLCADSDLFAAYLRVFAGQIDYSTFVAGAGRQLFGRLAGRLMKHS